jgi:BirA family biotin operon repressor/biotin-[acetyl-CoA-carboxylase] ligase
MRTESTPPAAPPPRDIAEAMLAAGPSLGPMAGRLLWLPETSSTNSIARAQAEHGADEGLVVAAGSQTAGRGRLGRTWVSPAGAGIYASVVLRPSLRVVPMLTLAAGVGIADGIAAATGLQTVLKWPNDIYAAGRKLCGILAEAAAAYVVVGFGINVRDAELPPDIAARSTSLSRECGRAVNRGEVLAACLAGLWRRCRDLEEHRERDVVDAWRERALPLMGRPIEWDHDGAVESGVAAGIDDYGALLMNTEGRTIRIVSGEVRWV